MHECVCAAPTAVWSACEAKKLLTVLYCVACESLSLVARTRLIISMDAALSRLEAVTGRLEQLEKRGQV